MSVEDENQAGEELSPAERYRRFRNRTQHPYLNKFAAALDYELDDFQTAACAALENGENVLVAAPTGAGKTTVAEFATIMALSVGKRAFYTTPIKALSNQKYRDFCVMLGAENVGLLTGDTSINRDADVVVMTTEVLRNMLYRESGTGFNDLAVVVMDEVHYLADRFRGPVWEEVLIHLPKQVRVVSFSATVSNAEEFGQWLSQVRGGCQVVVSEKRPVPLIQHMVVAGRLFDLYRGQTRQVNPQLADALRSRLGRIRSYRTDVCYRLHLEGLLPAIYFIFSRSGCDEAVRYLVDAGADFTTPEQKNEIRQAGERLLSAISPTDWDALDLTRWLEALELGIAAHHSGLLPAQKETVEELFTAGLISVVFATETLALGINMPARSVVLDSLTKWDGRSRTPISPGLYTQLTGRAGRRGIDTVGHAVVPYRPGMEPYRVAQLASNRTFPLISAFTPSYNMAVNMLSRMDMEAAQRVMESSFAQFQTDRELVGSAAKIRELDESIAQLSRDIDRVDVEQLEDYLKLLERQSQLSDSSKPGSHRASLGQMFKLHRSDVLEYRRGSRTDFAVVTSMSYRQGNPSAWVLHRNAKPEQLRRDDFIDGFEVIGQLHLDDLNHRHPRDRQRIASKLRAFLHQTQSNKDRHRGVAGDRSNRQELDKVTELIAAHPINTMPGRRSLIRKLKRLHHEEKQKAKLLNKIDSSANSLARDFRNTCAVLRDFGYLNNDNQPTAEAEILASIHAEYDLYIAESLRRGIFDELGPAELVAALSAMIDLKPLRDEPGFDPDQLPEDLVSALSSMAAIWADIDTAARHRHIKNLLKLPEYYLVPISYRWARGAAITEAIAASTVSVGDFVRWMKQLIDLLGQIERGIDGGIALTAHSAIRSIRRGMVAWDGLN